MCLPWGVQAFTSFVNKEITFTGWGAMFISKFLNILLHTQRGTSDSVANFSALSNPADAQNFSCLGLCSRDIYPKSSD